MSKRGIVLRIQFVILFLLLIAICPTVKAQAYELKHSAHVQDIGWTSQQSIDNLCGTTGESKRMEAIQLILTGVSDGSTIQYRTHVQNIGWQDYVSSGEVSGTTGQSLRIEALNIRLNGPISTQYDIYYRTHVQNIGWTNWVKNGALSGTTGQSLRMEALEIKLLKKGSSAPSDSETTNANGSLKVTGNQLTTQNGTPIQLKGVSTHGINWFPQYINQAYFSELKNNWKANVVRLAMYTSEYNGYCSGGNRSELKQLVKNGVNYASNAGLYVIVDWHILSDGNPNTYKNEAKEFFNEISSEFKNKNNVIYEICNEPNGGTTWNDIKNYANEVIPVIRANDPDAIILVGTPTWSQEIDKVAASPLNFSNILYTFHFYAGTHKDELRNRFNSVVESGLPVFVSEFGITDASGNGALDTVSGNQWISTLNNHKTSYVIWNVSNKNESSSLISSSCSKTSGFTNSDLSEHGNWFLGILKGNTGNSTPGSNQGGNSNSSNSGSNNQGQSGTSGNINYTLKATNTWSSNGKTYTQFEVNIKNNTNSDVSNWKVIIPLNQKVTIDNSWNGKFSTNGNSLIINNVDYNGKLAKGESTSVGMILVSETPINVK